MYDKSRDIQSSKEIVSIVNRLLRFRWHTKRFRELMFSVLLYAEKITSVILLFLLENQVNIHRLSATNLLSYNTQWNVFY